MKKQINQIREFFWPLLEPLHKETPHPKTILNIDEENLDIAYNLQNKIMDSEEDRRRGIESKAALFLSTISVASSVVIAAANSLISNTTKISLIIQISILVSLVLSIYAIRTVWYSVKALERKAFKVMGFRDFNIKGSKSEYQKSIILKMNEYASYNQKIINEKIDFLTMAQEYYKRAIVVISLYAVIICIYTIIPEKQRGVSSYHIEKQKNLIQQNDSIKPD